jgi:DNA-binding FrmR family transcriptional regulator
MEEKQDILRRVRIATGHLEGVARMIERDEYCIDVIKQIQAVEASLNRLATKILANHLHSCVASAVRGDDPSAREKVLGEIAEIFETATRV